MLQERGDSLLNPLSVVTKSLAKRVPSLSPAHSGATPEKTQSASAASTPVGHSAQVTLASQGGTTPPASSQSDENLEDSMKKVIKLWH